MLNYKTKNTHKRPNNDNNNNENNNVTPMTNAFGFQGNSNWHILA